MDCRFAQAQGVRASYGSARIDRPGALDQMAALRQRAGRDLAVATRINGQINARAWQFDVRRRKFQSRHRDLLQPPGPAGPGAPDLGAQADVRCAGAGCRTAATAREDDGDRATR